MAYATQGGVELRDLDGKEAVVMEKGPYDSDANSFPFDDDGNEGSHPTEEEKNSLRKVAGKIPNVAYWLCAVEFAERASYYGVQGLFTNFINRPLPKGGNGLGAPGHDSKNKTAGALGKGQSTASAITQSFKMMVYAMPVLFGWLADTKTGRFRLIWWGVVICAAAHVLMVGSSAPSLLATGRAFAPFVISVYTLAIGAAMFKPNISPTLLDQMPVTIPVTKTLAKTGERVIVDPEATTERVMLWFYLLINIGGMFSTPTTYIEKYYGFWLAYFVPTILYVALLPMLLYLKKRLVLKPAGGSDLGKVVRILGICFRRGGFVKMFRGDFFAAAKPSVIAASNSPIQVPWTDGFVEDVRHAFQATGIFCFFPIQMINDNGLGESANFLSTMLKGDGVPNDVMNNFNSLIIILSIPVMNYGVYPWLRQKRIKFGSVAQITTGFAIATLGGLGYTILNHLAYKTGPCGKYGSSEAKCVDDGLVAPISLWWMALPYALGGLSEIFVNVPAYGIAYARSPPNMRGLVSAINLFASAVSYAIGLAFTGVVKDPYLTWVFGVPTALGGISTVVFWFMYKDLDEEEFSLVSASELEEKAHSH
ncbi:hypothetical protein FKW77_003758 [Venturia effusa]|uniref:Major facilitator superfamily (MFS) profile domain-containing protein n=1 Tax=Venturia effusa TaxID=50376 RepID=A0A517LL75_9PEZI|nr:hypothetical protein FKW77_003758 [Venturia effusa]